MDPTVPFDSLQKRTEALEEGLADLTRKFDRNSEYIDALTLDNRQLWDEVSNLERRIATTDRDLLNFMEVKKRNVVEIARAKLQRSLSLRDLRQRESWRDYFDVLPPELLQQVGVTGGVLDLLKEGSYEGDRVAYEGAPDDLAVAVLYDRTKKRADWIECFTFAFGVPPITYVPWIV